MDASHRSRPFVKIVKYGFFPPKLCSLFLRFIDGRETGASNEQNFNRFQPKTRIKQDWLAPILPRESFKFLPEDESFFLKGEGHVRLIPYEILTKLSMCLPRFENSPSLSVTRDRYLVLHHHRQNWRGCKW